MKKIFLILIILTFTSVSFSLAEHKDTLLLTIETDKQQYGVGDKVKIIYTIINRSSEPISFYAKEPKFEFTPADDISYEEVSKIQYQMMIVEPPFMSLQPGEKFIEETHVASIRDGVVYKYSGGKGTKFEKKAVYNGLYISTVLNKNFLAKEGVGEFNVSMKLCDDNYLDDCLGCPQFFRKEDCPILETDLKQGWSQLTEKLKQRRREHWEKIKNKIDDDIYELNRKYYLEDEDYEDWMRRSMAESHCEKIKDADVTWSGCLDSNVLKIKIVDDKKKKIVTRILEPKINCQMKGCSSRTNADGSCRPCNKCFHEGWIVEKEREKMISNYVEFMTEKNPPKCENVKDDCSPPCTLRLEANGYFGPHKNSFNDRFFVLDWEMIES